MSNRCTVCGGRHENACHRCPHAIEISAGKYSKKPIEKTPCFACMRSTDGKSPQEHMAPSNHGRIHVSLDVVTRTKAAADSSGQSDSPLTEFLDFLTSLASLDAKARDVVMLRLLHDMGRADWEYKSIAKLHRVSPQAIEQLHRKAIESSPVLQRVFAWKLARSRNTTLSGPEAAAGSGYDQKSSSIPHA